MKLAIMQPYVFPYLGYFQLIKSVDKFVIYDDVTFIKQGWINRNNILANDKAYLFTIPLANASSFININETYLNSNIYDRWLEKFLKTLRQFYGKAPFFNDVFDLVQKVFGENSITISALASKGFNSVANYLNIATEFIETSSIYKNSDLRGQERILDICAKEGASHYINAIGGMELYSKEDFNNKLIELQFIRSQKNEYKQFNNQFVPWLSIIDVMMFNAPFRINEMLNQYELV